MERMRSNIKANENEEKLTNTRFSIRDLMPPIYFLMQKKRISLNSRTSALGKSRRWISSFIVVRPIDFHVGHLHATGYRNSRKL